MPRCIPEWSALIMAKLPLAGAIRSAIKITALLAGGLPAAADFPERNITLIVPFAAGGSDGCDCAHRRRPHGKDTRSVHHHRE